MLDMWASSLWTFFDRDTIADGIDKFLIEFHRLDNWVNAVISVKLG